MTHVFHSFPFMCFGPSVWMYVSGGCGCSVSLQPLFIKRLSLHSPLDHFFYHISRCQMPLSLVRCSFKRSPIGPFFLLCPDYQLASSLDDAHDISVVTQNLETTAFYAECLVMTVFNLTKFRTSTLQFMSTFKFSITETFNCKCCSIHSPFPLDGPHAHHCSTLLYSCHL